MPTYFPNEMGTHHGLANPHQSIQQVVGEFMKAGLLQNQRVPARLCTSIPMKHNSPTY